MKPKEPGDGDRPFPPIHIDAAGTITCGKKRFAAQESTLRRQILEIIGKSSHGHLLRDDYVNKLINAYIRPIDVSDFSGNVLTEPYIRRKNNVDKAISRLRKDLLRVFKKDLPEGATWLSFSKKLDGWLLYRLPSRGCDGELHPS